MEGQTSLGREVETQIRFGLSQLPARNAFHEFERLCLNFANATLGGYFVPATGPVGAGGDHGRDFSSHVRWIRDPQGQLTAADDVVAICTIQARNLVSKIRSDLRKVADGAPVAAVLAFLLADLPAGPTQALQEEAYHKHGIRLEIFDGHRLANRMATVNFAATAYQLLGLDQRSLPLAARATEEAREWASEVMHGSFRPELYDYLKAIQQAHSRHPWPFVDQVPDLAKLYQPQSLADMDGKKLTWHQAMDRSQHLWISAPAGAGKSSLLNHLAATIADQWLQRRSQKWLPVPVRARDLADGKAMTEALREAVQQGLGGLLRQPLPADTFECAPPATRWLVLIDGFDEIRDPDRRKATMQALVAETRRSSTQFIVTSRPGATDHIPDSFDSYTLQAFEWADVHRYVARWHELSGQSAAAAEPIVRELIGLLNRSVWQPTPLVLAMICTHAGSDTATPLTNLDEIYTRFVERLVARLRPTTEPAINALQDQIHTLLEDAASYRLSEDPEAALLERVVVSAAAHGIAPSAPWEADWNHTVQEVLLHSGLITKHGTDLEFLHSTFEDYYAIRALSNPEPEQTVDVLAQREGYFDGDDDLVLANLHLIELLIDRSGDVDAAIACLVNAYPTAAATLVEFFDSRDLGEQTTEALHAVMANDSLWLDREELMDVASVLDDVKRGHGLPYLLTLSIDLDLDDSERLKIIEKLARRGGEAAAAIKWLTWETLENTRDFAWQYEAGPLVSFVVGSDDQSSGLVLIARTTSLPDRLRIAACCDLFEFDQEQAYRLARACAKPKWLAMDINDSNRSCAPMLMERLVMDDTVSFADRLYAVESVGSELRDWAEELYRLLAGSASINDEQRKAAIAAAVRIGRE
jgi:hypothetical protein